MLQMSNVQPFLPGILSLNFSPSYLEAYWNEREHVGNLLRQLKIKVSDLKFLSKSLSFNSSNAFYFDCTSNYTSPFPSFQRFLLCCLQSLYPSFSTYLFEIVAFPKAVFNIQYLLSSFLWRYIFHPSPFF